MKVTHSKLKLREVFCAQARSSHWFRASHSRSWQQVKRPPKQHPEDRVAESSVAQSGSRTFLYRLMCLTEQIPKNILSRCPRIFSPLLRA
jgi:hypothetical protein